MIEELRSLSESEGGRRLPSRRDVLVAATAALTSAAIQSPAVAGPAAEGTAGFFLVFNSVGGNQSPPPRLFFIPSAWLEAFEVTDIYKTSYSDWAKGIQKIKDSKHGRGAKISAFYADWTEAGVVEAMPGRTVISPAPLGSGQTYLAAMVAPDNILL